MKKIFQKLLGKLIKKAVNKAVSNNDVEMPEMEPVVNTQLLRKPFKQRTSGFREFLFLTKF